MCILLSKAIQALRVFSPLSKERICLQSGEYWNNALATFRIHTERVNGGAKHSLAKCRGEQHLHRWLFMIICNFLNVQWEGDPNNARNSRPAQVDGQKEAALHAHFKRSHFPFCAAPCVRTPAAFALLLVSPGGLLGELPRNELIVSHGVLFKVV